MGKDPDLSCLFPGKPFTNSTATPSIILLLVPTLNPKPHKLDIGHFSELYEGVPLRMCPLFPISIFTHLL